MLGGVKEENGKRLKRQLSTYERCEIGWSVSHLIVEDALRDSKTEPMARLM